MIFNKFTSIENSYRTKFIDIVKDHGFDHVQYQVSEKIDGANFQFIATNEEVVVASRKNIVDYTFYNCGKVIELYSDKVADLKKLHYPESEQIAIYGELYNSSIQGRVFYSNQVNFIAFEIQVDGVVLGIPETTAMLNFIKIPMVPVIKICNNLDEALAISNTFDSILAKTNNPDKIFAEGENLAEGVVITPVQPLFLKNGNRVIIKNKNENFSEKTAKKLRKEVPTNKYIPTVEQYVNQNRLDAVLSKESNVLEPKDFGRIIAAMCSDVITDMVKDGDLPEKWKKLDDAKMIGKAVSNVVSRFLKRNLLHKL